MRGSGISWAICKSASRSRQITTPAPHHSVFAGRMPFLPPNQQRQSTEGKGYSYKHYYFGRQQGHAARMLTKPEVSTPRSVSQRPQTGKPMAVNRFHHHIGRELSAPKYSSYRITCIQCLNHALSKIHSITIYI